MVAHLDQQAVKQLENPAFRAYAQTYVDIQADFKQAVADFGLPFSEQDPLEQRQRLEERIEHLRQRGCTVANNDKSLSIGWISPACVACRLGAGTETFLTSTQCSRNCYFCFNPNQVDYEYYLSRVHDLKAELDERKRAGIGYTHLALTGGEPLLHKAETIGFFEHARELYPNAHTRLYTSGAGMDAQTIAALAQAGLREVRFSIKLEDSAGALQGVLDAMEACVGTFEAVMVEMPVMPDAEGEMRELLLRLDGMGVRGINLLELCFPLHNAPEFAKRGYCLKSEPYRVLYDYWYAGGLPIAGSEELCLNLLDFAFDQKLGLGVHYCSLENKFTGQVYQQNAHAAPLFPLHALSPRDHFLKSAKVFGSDAVLLQGYFQSAGITDFSYNGKHGFLEFPLALLGNVAVLFPKLEVGLSTCIVEARDGQPALRELAIDLITPESFDAACDL